MKDMRPKKKEKPQWGKCPGVEKRGWGNSLNKIRLSSLFVLRHVNLGSSVHETVPAGMLEQVSTSSSRGSSPAGDRTAPPGSPALQADSSQLSPPGSPLFALVPCYVWYLSFL